MALFVLGSVAFLCGCAGDSSDPLPTESQGALLSPAGGTPLQRCKQSLGECTIGCDASYREQTVSGKSLTSAYRKACDDACDAAYRRCTAAESREPNALP